MGILQCLVVLALILCAFVSRLRERSVLCWVFLLAAFMLANHVASAADRRPSMTVAVIIDTDFVKEVGEDAARDWVALTLSDAYKIYASQVGIDLRTVVTDLKHIADDTQPQFLLSAVQRYRTLDTLHYEAGATIFFTRRSLKIGNNAYAGWGNGPAYTSTAAAIIKLRTGPTADAEVLAHELGHVFGLPHDGEGSCADEQKFGYIMSGSGTGSTQFSPCSLRLFKLIIADNVVMTPPAKSAPAQTAEPVSGGGGLGEWIVIALLVLYGAAQTMRANWWRATAAKYANDTDEALQKVAHSRTIILDTRREIESLRHVLGGKVREGVRNHIDAQGGNNG